MDVILCRNVIIYFDLETKTRVIKTFEEKLRPGGYLLLGHSESLINITSAFELCHLRNDMVYRRPRRGEPARIPGTPPRPRPRARWTGSPSGERRGTRSACW